MRAANTNTISYAPNQVPTDQEELVRFLTSELKRIQAAIDGLAAGHLDKTYVAPTKPRDGDWRYADGTSWNPGSGQGFYGYYGAAWHFLG